MAENHSRLVVLLQRVELEALLYMMTPWRRHEFAELTPATVCAPEAAVHMKLLFT